MHSNEELVAYLEREGVLTHPEISAAFLHTDRKRFVPLETNAVYQDAPIPIGYGQTNSQPRVVAFMLELLGTKRGERILDVGSGSGWTTALLAELVGPAGKVYGVEKVPGLVQFGTRNLGSRKNATIRQASAMVGLPTEAPFDRILVSAAADDVPISLLEQLKTGGVLVIPIQDAIWKVVKGTPDIEKYDGFRFVPLV